MDERRVTIQKQKWSKNKQQVEILLTINGSVLRNEYPSKTLLREEEKP